MRPTSRRIARAVVTLSMLSLVCGAAACSIDPTVGPPEKVNDRKAPEIVLDHRGLGVPVDTLPSTVLSASDSFGVLTSIAITGDFLVVGEAYDAPFLHILDRTSGTLLTSAGRQGNGPGEFTFGPQFVTGAVTERTDLWLAPQLQSHAVVLNIPALVEKRADWLRRSLRIEDTGFRPNGIRLAENEWLVRSYTPEGDAPLLLFDSLGTRQGTIGTVSIADDRIRKSERWGAYMFNLCGSPDGQHVALPFSYTGRLEIRSPASKAVVEASVPYRYRPHLPLIGKILMMFKSGTAGTRYAYGDCVATDSLIYASFRGHVRGKVRKAPPPANTFIHVFNWSGKLLRVHHLDHSIGGLDLDRANNVLYTVSNYPDSAGPTVRRTVLPR